MIKGLCKDFFNIEISLYCFYQLESLFANLDKAQTIVSMVTIPFFVGVWVNVGHKDETETEFP